MAHVLKNRERHKDPLGRHRDRCGWVRDMLQRIPKTQGRVPFAVVNISEPLALFQPLDGHGVYVVAGRGRSVRLDKLTGPNAHVNNRPLVPATDQAYARGRQLVANRRVGTLDI